MTRRLPLVIAVLAFGLVPFVWFRLAPTWAAYLVLASLLCCLAVEAWRAMRQV